MYVYRLLTNEVYVILIAKNTHNTDIILSLKAVCPAFSPFPLKISFDLGKGCQIILVQARQENPRRIDGAKTQGWDLGPSASVL